jgi:hypothetical protein
MQGAMKWEGLRVRTLAPKGGRNMATKMTAPASEPELEEQAEQRLSDIDHADELDRMNRRIRGLVAALEGIRTPFDDETAGVLILAEDVAEKMQQCADAFDDERKLRNV